jgi:hypothetical protein
MNMGWSSGELSGDLKSSGNGIGIYCAAFTGRLILGRDDVQFLERLSLWGYINARYAQIWHYGAKHGT